MQSDHTFRRPAYWLADQLADTGSRIHVGEFGWASPARRGDFGACHGLEVPFVFDTLERSRLTRSGPRPLAEALHASWVRFITEGDPSSPTIGSWPRYDRAERLVQILDHPFRVEPDPLSDRRAFLETHDRDL